MKRSGETLLAAQAAGTEHDGTDEGEPERRMHAALQPGVLQAGEASVPAITRKISAPKADAPSDEPGERARHRTRSDIRTGRPGPDLRDDLPVRHHAA